LVIETSLYYDARSGKRQTFNNVWRNVTVQLEENARRINTLRINGGGLLIVYESGT